MKFTPRAAVLSGKSLALSLLLLTVSSVQAKPETASVSFSHKDWDLICDNTLTCRAAGYSADNADPAATVLLTRKAGPATPIDNKVMLADYDGQTAEKAPGAPQLLIADHSLGKLMHVDGDAWQMTPLQFAAFIKALRQDSRIVFKDTANDYVFSSAGSSAVLLKMDDVQGRVGTKGALIKKGDKDESGVKAPVPVPVIVKSPVTDKTARNMTPAEAALIRPALLKLISQSESDCDEERLADAWQIAALNQTKSLVMIPCWMAAYNGGDLYFVVDKDMKTSPELISDSANSYEEGVIGFAMKGRGLGDCWTNEEWVWNGQRFVQSLISNTGRCRLIRPGGAWDMIELRTSVQTQ